MANLQVDILVIGGGLAGATLMLALRNLGYNTLLVEAHAFDGKRGSNFDARSLALSPASQLILHTLGIWDVLQEKILINSIHVSDQYRFGATRLEGNQSNPLGYVVEMQDIHQALHQLLDKELYIDNAQVSSLDLESKIATVIKSEEKITIQAQLIVAADGADSLTRQFCKLPVKIKDYHQQALVANIGLIKDHENKAYERFTQQGPLALLPMSNKRMSLVWAMNPSRAEQLLVLDEQNFLRELQKAFGFRLGRFLKVGARYSYPLKQVLMPQPLKWPVIFLGNAAHTLHPVAGQGFNLGLRDAATLAQCISQKGLNEAMLHEYLKLRQHDQQVIIGLTNQLIKIFTARFPGVGVARSLGLIALDNIPALKNWLTLYTSGFGGFVPDLVCEKILNNERVT